ncbi:MAG: alcohol acetyltransferase [Alkalispirochaeta sp.]
MDGKRTSQAIVTAREESHDRGDGVGDEHYSYRLDNAAKIFPGMLSRRRSTVFRLAATLREAIDVATLQEAYDAMLQRCPYFHVELRKGVFWYYFERSAVPALVEAESRYPCMYIPFKRRGVHPFRLIAFRNRIAFEVSHILTDGAGALAFLNGVIAEYLRRRGVPLDTRELPVDVHRPIDEEEYEDSFAREYRPRIPPAPPSSPALHFGGTAMPPPVFLVVEGRIPGKELKNVAREQNVTIGEYLTALLIDVAREEMEFRGLSPRPIRVSIPINLRRFFPSRTMRNFVLAVDPGVDFRLGDFGFDDILAKVHYFMRSELDAKHIRRQIVRNMKSEKNPFIRIVPLLIKDPILRWAYSLYGTRNFTIGFSNLGNVSVPEAMQPYIEGYSFIPPPHNNALNATAIAFAGETRLAFAGTTGDRSIERRFFARLRERGVPVAITTNRS